MTAKEYLQQIYIISKKIERLEAQREMIRQDMYSLKSPAGNMNADKVQATSTGDKIERLIARVDRMERSIVAQKKRLLAVRSRIVKEIEQLPHEKQRELLHRRYVSYQRWEQIAVDMNVSLRYVYMLHGDALQAFEKAVKIP